jgi:signal transduction histidine kinase
MEKIVGKLLFLSKADRGEIALEGGPVDFHPLVERVYHQFQRPAEEKNLTLHFKSEGSVPGHGDELLLREVLMNLIQNAINATPSGGEISLSLHKEKETIRILIEDTGCGIPEKDSPHIFNRFYKVDKSHSGQGSGLGLCICKWIVEAHRAVIMVESTSGKGSRFILAFPKPPFSES